MALDTPGLALASPARRSRRRATALAFAALACCLARPSRAFARYVPTSGSRRRSSVRATPDPSTDLSTVRPGVTAEGADELVTDFGFQVNALRMAPNNYAFVANASVVLGALQNPETLLFSTQAGAIQRNLDTDNLDSLRQYQVEHMQNRGFYSFPVPIMVAKYMEQYAVLDGQHRLETIRYLLRSGAAPIRLLISMFELRSLEEYDDLFVALNKNKPVRLYRNTKGWKEVLKSLENYFADTFPKYLTNRKRPLRHTVRLDALMEYMDENDVVARIGLGYEDLVREIEELNMCYRTNWKELIRDPGYIKGIEKLAATCNKTNPDRPLFLGIFRAFEWLRRIELKVCRGIPYRAMNHVPDSFRPKISAKLKRSVWMKRNKAKAAANSTGQCIVCYCELLYQDMRCGHVQSLSNCGATSVENLEPMCETCFDDLGTEDLDALYERNRIVH